MSESKPINPCILLITTRKYKQFTQPLINDIDKYFLPDHKKTIFLFTDEYQSLVTNSYLSQCLIPPYEFPDATWLRYVIFNSYINMYEQMGITHLYYMDADMGIIDTVGEEFITDTLIAIKHPGFFKNNAWGDSNNPTQSLSFLKPELRRHYFCGGVQGGQAALYLEAVRIMSEWTIEDRKNGIKPEHNDETMWNKYLHTSDIPITEFTPSYCMPEPERLRHAWGISDLKPIILALDKNHKEIRS